MSENDYWQKEAARMANALRIIAYEREHKDGRVGWHGVTARTPREIAREVLEHRHTEASLAVVKLEESK